MPLESPSEHLKPQRQGIGPQGSKPDVDPGRRLRYHAIILVDDLVEPPHLFEGHMPAKFADRTPRVIDRDDGPHAWLLDQVVLDEIAVNAVTGNEIDDKFIEPMRFDVVRRGTRDIKARIVDMDIDGVYASKTRERHVHSARAGEGSLPLLTGRERVVNSAHTSP